MLKFLREGEKKLAPCVLLLGGFDGLHFGHRLLLGEAKKTGLPVGITSITGGKGSSLFTAKEREAIFARAGIDFVYEIGFTDEVRNTCAEDFLDKLFMEIPVKAVFCGEDFRFGRDALGTPALLKKHAPCAVNVIKIAERGGKKVSISACKELLSCGEMPKLNELLGEPYFIEGEVEHGRQVGRTYGFPTLNLTLSADKLTPKEGVYGGYAETPKGTYKTIVNVGARPTFDVAEKKIEAYLDGFSGDLYGATVRIFPTEFYRGITKFSSANELKEQLEKDIGRLKKNEV